MQIWFRHSFRFGKRGPSRFGKRGPSRFGKRSDFDEDIFDDDHHEALMQLVNELEDMPYRDEYEN